MVRMVRMVRIMRMILAMRGKMISVINPGGVKTIPPPPPFLLPNLLIPLGRLYRVDIVV
jgi:hypothetical protein